MRAKKPGDADQSVAWYMAHTPAGYRGFPANQHAHTDGHVRMLEHFKIGKLHHRDPRLYYWDDTTRTGKVYIGYIGTHLTNTQT